jgi:hypothetical protein
MQPDVAQEQFLAEVSNATTSAPVTVSPVQFEQVTTKGYTKEDLEKVREQEKSKLYPQIDGLKEEVALLKKEREDRVKAEEAQRLAAEEAAKKKQEDDMDVRSLLEKKEREWEDRFNNERLERERTSALLDQERRFAELNDYRNHRVSEESESIMPELLDLVTGNTPEEIEQSIAGLKDRSVRILEAAQQSMQNARRDMVGSRVTVPPTGPMDTNLENQQFTAEQISAMSVTEFAKHRGKLLGQAANARGRGLFG